jgi:hypothetical protein
MVNQSIKFHRPNKKVSEKTMAHSIPQVKHALQHASKKIRLFHILIVMGRQPMVWRPHVMVARSVRNWREVSMGRNVGRGPLPTAEQEEGFSLLILAYFISHPLIT